MSDEPRRERGFLETLTLLMSLTRERKLQWQKKQKDGPFLEGTPPPYEATLENLHFRLEGVPVVASFRKESDLSKYRLIIQDLTEDVRMSSPRMKAAGDLAAVIQSVEQTPDDDLNQRLRDVNRRLEAAK